MQKCGSVFPCRTFFDDVWSGLQYSLQGWEITADYRLDRCLVAGDLRVRATQLSEMLYEFRPACETVLAGDEELSVRERAPGSARAPGPVAGPVLFDPPCFALDFFRYLRCDRLASKAEELFDPLRRGAANSTSVARLAGELKVPGQFLVLLEIGTRREPQCIRHTNLLSLNAWSSHLSGGKKVRHLVGLVGGWAQPFPRTGCVPNAIQFFITEWQKKQHLKKGGSVGAAREPPLQAP